MKRLLTVDEVCELLGLKRPRVYQLTRENKIPHVVIGEKQYRYSEERLVEWAERGGNIVESRTQDRALAA